MKKIEHLPTNWINGLKLNSRHFFETYYNMVETMHLEREESLCSYNYGFGESMTDSSNPVEMEAKGDSVETFQVQLKSCNAVTRNGYHIVYVPSLYGDHVPTARLCDVEADFSAEQSLYIILSVNPYKLLPVGIPEPETTPLHHPYTLPEITLQLATESQMNKAFLELNCIIAGKCIINGSHFAIDEQYIPPVQKTGHAKRLVQFLSFLTEHIKSIYGHSLVVCRKNVRDSRREILVENTFSLCRVIQDFYAKNIFDLESLSIEQPPVYMVQKSNALANMLLTALRSMPENEYEMLLQYYNEWINVKPSDFIKAVGDVASLSYKHTDITEPLVKIRDFFTMLEKLFKKISELEYVGLMRDNIIVSEDSDKVHSSTNRSSLQVWE